MSESFRRPQVCVLGSADDYPQQVLDAWSPQPDEHRYTWMRGQIESSTHAVIVAEEQSGVISGFCMFSNADGAINALYVLPERTGNGIGRLLLKRAEGVIAESGFTQINVNSSNNALGFYESVGYDVVGMTTQQLADGTRMDCHAMVKKLTNASSLQARPGEVVNAWVAAFNRADVDALTDFYADDAVNHQVAEQPRSGKKAIREMFAEGFATANMICIVENVFEDGEWAILEWKDPLGLRGCGFFHVIDGKIVFQRGYWDKLTFLRMHGLPVPQE
jgi:ribosomal protein S18 acetylase RimI-like enzyme/limonene-1,2-epoxide hydrolase